MHGSGFVIAGLFLALWTPVVVLAPAIGARTTLALPAPAAE
jgi:hypothetical protein